MFILYGDDEKLARDLVKKALTSSGYQVETLDTSRADDMTVRLAELRQKIGMPQVFILDGHNILLDGDGNQLFDMTPLGMINWLRKNGIDAECKFILYSNDDRLVEQARTNRCMNFFAAVAKGGTEGGLMALLKAVKQATTPANPASGYNPALNFAR